MSALVRVDSGFAYTDICHTGNRQLIACAVIDTSVGPVLVDPGPTSCMATLEGNLAGQLADVHGILLTHIHLDHAGATGALVQRFPHLKVYVHERGARHLIRPERLTASAMRIYGDRMGPLWGAVVPVPENAVRSLQGGEELCIGRRRLEVAYTPGHASHHVCFRDHATGTVLAGDIAGLRVPGADLIIPVAPPPDINLAQWRESLSLVRGWKPDRLFLTHFGPVQDVGWHLDEVERRLEDWAMQVRCSLASDDAQAEQAFHERNMADMRRRVDGPARTPYEIMGQPRESWKGLARYWRKCEKDG